MMKEDGFSAVKLLSAVTVTIIVMIASLGAFNDSLGLNEKATLTADLGQNLQAGANLMIRDFVRAGWGIPTGGIPIPTGAGSSPVKRPGPPGTTFTFDPSATTLAAVNAGNALGPTVIGRKTDIVNILCADNSLLLNERPLTAIAANGTSMTVDARTPINGDNAIRAGDLIMFSNALGNALQQVSGVAGQNVSFAAADSLNL